MRALVLNGKVIVVAILLSLISSTALAKDAEASIVGPIKATDAPGSPSHNYPFFSSSEMLAKFNYVEEEYFIEGKAHRYEFAGLATAKPISGEHPYRTRILVRHPAAAKNFSGIALVEWMNVTPRFDFDVFWMQGSAEHLMSKGHVWIGVSVQQDGIHAPNSGLKAWSPNRYGSLDLTDGGKVTDDSLSFDVFTQAARAISLNKKLLNGLTPKKIIAVGSSFSGKKLTDYYNGIQPVMKAFDGYLLSVGGEAVRDDLHVPIFKIYSEHDFLVPWFKPEVLQPDSDFQRTWVTVGTGHIEGYFYRDVVAKGTRDDIFKFFTVKDCGYSFTNVPRHYAVNAALDHLVKWLDSGILPPKGEPLDILSKGPPLVVRRDQTGVATGGIRYGAIEAPLGVNSGMQNTGPGFCFMLGRFKEFDKAELKQRYPTREKYLESFVGATLKNLKAGYMVPEDAIAEIEGAYATDPLSDSNGNSEGKNPQTLRTALPSTQREH